VAADGLDSAAIAISFIISKAWKTKRLEFYNPGREIIGVLK
jgi:hypothetical protein